MRTKVEIGDFEITIEEDEDGVITVSAEKDGETVEDFTLGESDDEETDDNDSDENDESGLKPFGGEDVEADDEESDDDDDEDEDESKMESLRAFGEEEKVEKVDESKDTDELKDFETFA